MKLRAFEQRWAAVLCRSLIPQGALGGAIDDVDAGALVAADCAASPWAAALSLRAGLWMVWLSPLFTRGRFFGGLEDDQRVALLERLLVSRVNAVRMLAMLVKLMLVSIVLGDLRVLQHVGAYGMKR